ncbi:uncharacterized protein [Coffea arabica]|uniref:Reverse transcriptase domain-containing protein n=1 Tax=Coffea arabica TaxID=13443 RepID=A0ABM4VBX0_COFAR
MIHRIKKSNGVWVDADADIESEAISYFSNLFSSPSESASDMLHLIPHMISGEDNGRLEAVPSMEDVHRVVRAMDGDSAAGPDGFTGKFYTLHGKLLRRIFIARVLADRVAGVLPKIISAPQTGVSWLHIIGVLRKFGFGELFIDLVWWLLYNVWFSVIINGSSYGFFKSMKELRQGDPLSSALFIIGAEVLSRDLNDLMVQLSFLGFKVPYGCPSVTHLAFADDVLIFTNGSSSSLNDIKQVLEMYQRCLGQLINAQKSGYLVHPSLSLARKRVIERVMRKGPVMKIKVPVCGRQDTCCHRCQFNCCPQL